MRTIFLYTLFSCVITASYLFSQTTESQQIKGTVSFISSQNIYVKFDNTGGINPNDTLYYLQNNQYVPAILVEYISSQSCAGIPLTKNTLKIGTILHANIIQGGDLVSPIEKKTVEAAGNLPNIDQQPSLTKSPNNEIQSKVYGRISISSYSNLSNISGENDHQRWRYRFSLNANNMFNSKISYENYITFTYRADQWNIVTNNLGRAIRIYNLAISYNFNDYNTLSFGRKIYPKISNIGAVDGIFFGSSFDNFEIGAVIGSRPNFSDYGFNIKLFQYGGYISRKDSTGYGFIENSLAVFEQSNNFKTDRRFLYYQHNSMLIPRLNFFASTEIDIYKKVKGESKNEFTLTSLYLSARYSPDRVISFSASYDARKNVIYYETFKSIADSILESETRQGFRIQTTIRPINYLIASLNFGYRYKPGDYRPTRTIGGRISYSRIPLIFVSSTFSFNKLLTAYLDGNIYGIRFNKNLSNPQINFGVGFRKINYNFISSDWKIDQNILCIDLSYNIIDNIALSTTFESTFEGKRSYNRVFLNLNTSFK